MEILTSSQQSLIMKIVILSRETKAEMQKL